MNLTPYEERLVKQNRAKRRKRKVAPKKKGPSLIKLMASELVTNVLLLLLVALAILILFSGQ